MKKVLKLNHYIKDNKELLENGETLTVLLTDGYVTIYNEVDEKTKMQKTITLVDPCDTHLDCEISQFITVNNGG